MQTLLKILKKPITAIIISIFLGFVVAAIILLLAGYNPIESFGALFRGILSRPKYISNVLIKSTPIIVTGIGVAFAFKTGLFNIGAEGQFITGSIASVIVGYTFNFHPVIQIPLVILAGMIAGGLWGSIVGFLKAKYGIHEVITSIMLNWIALYLCNFVVNSEAFHAPNSTATHTVNKSSFITILYNWKRSKDGMAELKKTPWLYDMLVKTDVNVGILIAIIVAILVWFLLYHSKKGYELRAVGLNRDAAEFAGINVNKNILQSMLISGAICGLAGSLVITGMAPHRLSQLAVFENNGFNGLSVALIAGSSPIGCIFSGLLFGGLIYGGQSMQSEIGAPTEVINIMIGTIVFFIALTTLIPQLINRMGRRGVKNAK